VLCDALSLEEVAVTYIHTERVHIKINISTIVLCEYVIQSASPHPPPHSRVYSTHIFSTHDVAVQNGFTESVKVKS
jgi:hypothetical protein